MRLNSGCVHLKVPSYIAALAFVLLSRSKQCMLDCSELRRFIVITVTLLLFLCLHVRQICRALCSTDQNLPPFYGLQNGDEVRNGNVLLAGNGNHSTYGSRGIDAIRTHIHDRTTSSVPQRLSTVLLHVAIFEQVARLKQFTPTHPSGL